MNSKEIAEAVGKPLRTVQDWVKNIGAKVASIGAKVASSTSTHPADYTLAEVCQIIEEGLGKAAADVYRTNAVHAEMKQQKGNLPSGAQMKALESIYGKYEAAKRIDFALGYKRAEPDMLAIGSRPLSKAAYAVEMKERAKEERKRMERKEPGLFT